MPKSDQVSTPKISHSASGSNPGAGCGLPVFTLQRRLSVWSSVAPISAEVVGIRDLPSALAVFWLATVLPGQFGQPIAVALINYSQNNLGRRGASTYLISIGFCGACFVVSALMLCMSWRYVRARNQAEELKSSEQTTAELQESQLASFDPSTPPTAPEKA